MDVKIQHGDVTYFRIPIELLVGDRAVDFPLYIFLEKNNSLILRFHRQSTPASAQLSAYLGKGLKHFVCPEEFRPHWMAYLSMIDPVAVSNYLATEKSLAAEAEIVLDIVQANEGTDGGALSQKRKREMLTSIGEKMVGVMNQMGSGDPEEKKKAFEECRQITDQVVQLALQSHEMKSAFEDLMMLKDGNIEHSSSVSTIAVIFALTVGFVDESGLAEISLGGLLHDLGHGGLPSDVLRKPYEKFDLPELEMFKQHAKGGLHLLQDIGEIVPPVVQSIVEEHHEKYNGEGFGKGLRGLQIDERVQIVSLADKVDDLMSGRMTGEALSPVAAFDWLRDRQRANDLAVSPELFETIYQCVMRTKPADFKNSASA